MKAPKKPIHRKRTPFYWWRRFRTHKTLPYKATLLDKIRNGDFEYPEYFQQARWELEWMHDEQQEFIKNYTGDINEIESDIRYIEIETRARKRYNKLYEDGMKTEFERMDDFKTQLCKEFKFNKDKLVEIMEEFTGTTEDLYFYVADLVGINVDTFNKLKSWGIK
mgnify:FL=1|jgi:hypothetical protein|tara:strand:+ start:572 stop:1066 length:495 start_codon:yes stop_codon:yes gene_type:complete